MKNGRNGGRRGASTSNKVPGELNNIAGFDCPACDRPTLQATPEELTDFRCSVCSERVREVNA